MVRGRIEARRVWHTAAGQGVGERPSGKILMFDGGETIVRDFFPFEVLGSSLMTACCLKRGKERQDVVVGVVCYLMKSSRMIQERIGRCPSSMTCTGGEGL